MCDRKRNAAPAPGFGFDPAAPPFGHQPHGCYYQRGCGPRGYAGRRFGHYQHQHHNNTGPIGAAVGAIGVIANAVKARSTPRDGHVAGAMDSAPRNQGEEQITGITSTKNMTQLPPLYPETGKAPMPNEKELEAHLDHVDEPPAYTPPSRPREATAGMRAAAPTQAQAQPPAQPLVSSQIREVNSSFAALPHPPTKPNPSKYQDIINLKNAIASITLGECGSRSAAKRARKQLVRDLWAAEKAKHGAMGCAERKAVKAQIKGVKRVLKAEMRCH